MPIYSFECDECKILKEIFMWVQEYKIPDCESCTKPMKRVYIYSVMGDIEPYKDQTLGYVGSRREKNEKMKKQGLSIFEPSELKRRNKKKYGQYVHAVESAKEKIYRAGKQDKYNFSNIY